MNPAGTLAAVTAPSAQRVFLVDIDAASAAYTPTRLAASGAADASGAMLLAGSALAGGTALLVGLGLRRRRARS